MSFFANNKLCTRSLKWAHTKNNNRDYSKSKGSLKNKGGKRMLRITYVFMWKLNHGKVNDQGKVNKRTKWDNHLPLYLPF